MDVNYDELRRIFRLEKNTSKLVEVEEDFFNSLNEFIKQEKKDYLASLKSDLDSGKGKNFTNMKKMIEELFLLRQKKLLNRALICSKTGERDESHMAFQEKEIFKKILSILKQYNEITDGIFNGEMPQDTKKQGKEAKNETKDLNNLSVRITSEVPSFVGTDMKEYGPFNKGEKVVLPYNIAKLFISRKLGEISD